MASKSNVIRARQPASIFPLRISGNGRYLTDYQGNPLLLMGDAGWSAAVQLSRSQMEKYLTHRQGQGINTVLLSLIEHKFSSQSPAYKNANGDAPFTTMSPVAWTNITEAYWAEVDYFVNACKSRNIVVIANPIYRGIAGTPDEGWQVETDAATDSDLDSYGQTLGNRYTQGNIIWCAGGDNAGNTTQRDKQYKVFSGIRKRSKQALITGHPARTEDTFSFWTGYDGFALNTIYTRPTVAGAEYGAAATAYAKSPTTPFVNLEGWYENENSVSAIQLRRQPIASILAGACGFIHGNNPIWGFGEPNANGGAGPAASLASGLSTNGYTWAAQTAQFFRNVQWWLLQPKTDTSLVTTALGSDEARVIPARASDGSFAMIYTPTVDFTVDMTNFVAPSVRGRWYDPAAGTYAASAGSPYSNSGTQAFAAPGERILVLDGAA